MYPMRMTNKQIQDALAGLREQLKRTKSASNTIKVEYTLPQHANKTGTTLTIKELAWKKIETLVNTCNKEVAWHGTVTKDNNGYTIHDIFVFPQTVTATTVTSDETEYSMWLAQQPNEIFDNLRFHGHSHVNMSVTPSGIDTTFQEAILQNLNDFYIFAIFNKRKDNWVNIFDVTDNIVYESKDIEVIIEDPVTDWATTELTQKVKSAIIQRTKPTATSKKEKSYAEEFVDRTYDKTGKKITTPIQDDDDDGFDYYGRYGVKYWG